MSLNEVLKINRTSFSKTFLGSFMTYFRQTAFLHLSNCSLKIWSHFNDWNKHYFGKILQFYLLRTHLLTKMPTVVSTTFKDNFCAMRKGEKKTSKNVYVSIVLWCAQKRFYVVRIRKVSRLFIANQRTVFCSVFESS